MPTKPKRRKQEPRPLPEPEFWDEVQAAAFLNVKRRTVQGWRFARKGPPYVKIGHTVRYRVQDLRDYLEANVVRLSA